MDQNDRPIEKEEKESSISRSDFIRSVGVIGLSLGVGKVLSGCGVQPTIQPDSAAAPTAPLPPTPLPTVVTNWSGKPIEEPPPATPWFCAACGNHFPSLYALRSHTDRQHSWRLPQIRQVDKPVYDRFTVEPIKRFDERNTVFSRSMWDKEYQEQMAAVVPLPVKDPQAAIEGRALVAGGIYVDDTAGSFHPNYYGYMGRVKNTEGLFNWDVPVGEAKYVAKDPEEMTFRVKQVARLYGACLVGVTAVDERWIYSHTFERSTGDYEPNRISYKYAVMLAVEMDWQAINDSPSYYASGAAALGYSRMAEVASSLARYIRGLGYPAVPSGNDTGQNVPMAIDAGLGEFGRHGLLITPEYGSRVRICKVFTDLPLVPDKPIEFGVQDFCETCHSCALSCPAKAIRNTDRTTEITSISNRKGLNRWPVDVAKCYLFWRANGGTDCSNCIAVCPWTLPGQRPWLET
jgi:epoxyqueuosine reductase